MLEYSDFIAYLLVSMKVLLIVVSIIFIISGLDDLFIDIYFMVRSLYRRYFVLPKYQALTENDLRRKPEKPIAVFVPAWDESAVIRPMLENTIKTLDYDNYYLFVGTYPNDLKTQQEVEKVSRNHKNVHCIVCPHDGPTNKADCLNWINLGIRQFEKQNNIHFNIFVMQDCEDVIHPLCYKLFNYLVPRKDMVQLPVLSLKTKWYQFTGGHYIDEFAQGHYKDITVREHINRSIPAAGTGCAFSRRAIDCVGNSNDNQVFSLNSLTEDYDFGFRLKEHGLKQIFVKFSIKRMITTKGFFTGKLKRKEVDEYVCIREYFPATLRAAVKQKSRWVVGIVFQGWANLGWKGGLSTKYMLFRDRKALVTNLANVLAYLIVFTIVGIWIFTWVNPDAYRFPAILEQGSWLWYLILINIVFLIARIFQRGYCVQRLYGWQQAFLSFPRMIWGNVINFLATCRAIKLYVNYLLTGKSIAWDKTDHHYPTESELAAATHSSQSTPGRLIEGRVQSQVSQKV